MTYGLYFSHILLSSLSSSLNGLHSQQLATGTNLNFGTQYTLGSHPMLPSPSLALSSFLQSAPNPSDWDQSTLYLISFPSNAETTVISGIEWVCFNTVSLGHGKHKHRKLKSSLQHFSSSCAGIMWLSLVQHSLRCLCFHLCASAHVHILCPPHSFTICLGV